MGRALAAGGGLPGALDCVAEVRDPRRRRADRPVRLLQPDLRLRGRPASPSAPPRPGSTRRSPSTCRSTSSTSCACRWPRAASASSRWSRRPRPTTASPGSARSTPPFVYYISLTGVTGAALAAGQVAAAPHRRDPRGHRRAGRGRLRHQDRRRRRPGRRGRRRRRRRLGGRPAHRRRAGRQARPPGRGVRRRAPRRARAPGLSRLLVEADPDRAEHVAQLGVVDVAVSALDPRQRVPGRRRRRRQPARRRPPLRSSRAASASGVAGLAELAPPEVEPHVLDLEAGRGRGRASRRGAAASSRSARAATPSSRPGPTGPAGRTRRAGSAARPGRRRCSASAGAAPTARRSSVRPWAPMIAPIASATSMPRRRRGYGS